MVGTGDVLGHAIGQVISFGVAVSVSPLAIIAVILMLSTPAGRANSLSFLAGWVLGLATLGTLVLLVADGADAAEGSEPADWVGVVQIVLAALLLLVAVRQWRQRPSRAEEAELAGWMQGIADFTPMRSATTAILIAAVKPKNLLLTVGAATAIAETGASSGQQATALAVFVVVGTLGPAIPVAVYFVMRDRAAGILDGMRTWMVRENTTIIIVLCLIVAAKLLGDAIPTLSS